MKSRKQCAVCVLAWAGSAVFFLAVRGTAARNHPQRRDQETDARSVSAARKSASAFAKARMAGLSMPITFEPNAGEADARVQYVGRGKGMSVWLERDEMRVEVGGLSRPKARGAEQSFGVRLRSAGRGKLFSRTAEFAWQGEQRLPGVSNYFVGNDPAKWRTRVPHYARAEAAEALPGVSVEAYGNDEGVEYDLRVAPGTDAAALRLDISGAEKMRLASDGDLVLRGGGNIFRMRKPNIYEEAPGSGSVAREGARRRVSGGYVIEADGSVGFRIGRHDAAEMLVIDPSLSVAYATFLGGAGGSTAESVAVDPVGNVYVAGTTATPATFPETGGKQLGPGPVNGTSGTVPEFFIAEINPAGGANSLVYLTFLGGSGIQTGGIIAVDALGDAFLTGTTTSGDYPVTDGSQLTPGPNDVVVSEIAAGGSALTFSTLFGGSESESQFSTGGIALDAAGDVYIAGDTNSTDLPVTTGSYQQTFGGTDSDGYLAVFTPGATPSLKYCTYLGTNSSGDVGVGGIAVDKATPANAYIAGFTENTASGFPAKGGFQTVYGGGTSNAFLMAISPAGQGPADLVYGTLLGGSVMDEALGVAVDFATPPNVYLTGITQSKDFPVNGTTAAYQTSLRANVATNRAAANAFLSVITQIPATGMTKLVYSTYLGGSQTDVGQGVAVESPTVVYVTGTTSSWDFPWKDNLQPFNGTGDAFIVKMNPQVAGTAGLLYATPLGGTAPPGESANAAGNSIMIGGTGLVYVGGQTTAADFPTAVSTAGTVNGFQAFCASCAASPPAGDAFVAGIAENAALAEPSVYFNTPKLNFPAAIVGTPANGPQLVAVFNGGEAPLSIASFTIIGANSRDFSLVVAPGACTAAGNPGAVPVCTFEVGFTPSMAGEEEAVVSFTDNAPGSPQALELEGIGEGLVASPGNINFGKVSVGSSGLGTITFTNTTATAAQSINVAETGPNTNEFPPETSASNCATSLSAGSSCHIVYEFMPDTTGPFQAQVVVTYQIVGQSGVAPEETITLTGVGTGAAPAASVAPLTLAFGSVAAGTVSGTQTAILTSEGSAPLNLSGMAITGTNAGDFAIVSAGTTCPTGAGTLGFGNPAPSCTVSIEFAPQSGDAAGAKSASLNFSDNASGSPQTVTLNGTATVPPPTLQISPTSLAFGSQSEGTSSVLQTVTITNPAGGISADISEISITGTNKGDFVLGDPCAPVLGVGSSCKVSVSFSPAVSQPAGNRGATLNVPGGSPAAVPLSGTATVAGICITTAPGSSTCITPSSGINFGSATACGPSPACATGTPVPLTVNNNGTGPLTFSGISIGGANAGDFVLGHPGPGSCTAGSTAPCTIQVTFAPACVNVPAARSATLTLVDNAPGSPQTIALSGTATGEFCIDPPAQSSMTQTVTQGETAVFPQPPANLSLLSPSGSQGTISLTCNVTPPTGTTADVPCYVPVTVTQTAGSVTCSQTTPATVTLPANFAVCVPTVAPSNSLLPEWPGGRGPGGPRVPVVATLLLMALVAAGGAASATGRRLRLAMLAQAVALLLALGAGMGACGGGGGATGNPGTPEQTYAVVVTATATDGTTQTINLTLIVN
jgi:Beta-propeller repeat